MQFHTTSVGHRRFALYLSALMLAVPTLGFLVSMLGR
jgi:hypothetical protein